MTLYQLQDLGKKIKIPEFWSTFVLNWQTSVGLSIEATIDTLNKLKPFIEFAEINGLIEMSGLPNDPEFLNGTQAGLFPTKAFPNASININPAWDLTTGNSNIKVGVLDSGINWDHEDFIDGKVVAPKFSRIKGAWDYGAIMPNNPLISPVNLDFDPLGHGTAMASVIGAIRNNNIGVASVAGGNGGIDDGVSLFSAKISREKQTFFSTALTAQAIVEGAVNTPSSNFGYGLNIMNCSFANANDLALSGPVQSAYQNDVIIISSSGNYGNNDPYFPASFKDNWVIKVGASDKNGLKLPISSYGFNLDFLAPGEVGLSQVLAYNNNTSYYAPNSGTSISAAYVSGVASLMLSYINSSKAPNKLAPEDVEILLEKFAKKIPNATPSFVGAGIIDAGSTLQNIRLPQYEVKHISKKFSNATAKKIASNKSVQLITNSTLGVFFTYFADVYEVTETIDLNLSSNRKIIDVWTRGNGSSVYEGPDAFEQLPFPTLVSFDPNKAIVKGYLYFLTKDKTGNAINKWFPENGSQAGLSGNSTIEITAYSKDPTVSDKEVIAINEEYARVIPNPSQGEFTVMFTLLKNTNLGIQVTDLSGKVVYFNPKKFELEGHKEINLDLSNLEKGIYICNIATDEGIINKKIVID